MLKAKQITCASELTQLLLNLYCESHIKAESYAIDSIIQLANLFPAGDSGKIALLKTAIKWSRTEGPHKQGEPVLHAHLAKAYHEASEYAHAQKHYLKSNQPQEFGQMLILWANDGYLSERDLYIARAIFMYLSLSNLRDANIIFQVFTQSLSPVQATPLLNYLKFLLLTLEHDAYPLFDTLRQKYKPSLSRDPSFLQYLDHIAQTFYKVKPQHPAGPGLGSFISDLFKNFLPIEPTISTEDAD